ncbi:LysR family transcriptional regulator [Vibrio sp. Isolate30]|uniref:LysR family transcriptional regulator n=1 Tax=Vibrio sp. Isolate30 TaxID=2908536 RepID=UPI001EFD818A|nr:LysR family transcriptional regulator [Vibrio sp. Isolate30]MCG9633398.1 LysR family transcriptional regulator [Vibrio sp. Isolate30]
MKLPLSTLEVFNAIASKKSLRGAAQELGVKPSTVSHQLKKLEEQLGTTLFIRTTRSINLTEAGRALARSTGPAFEQLAEGLYSARTAGHAERGSLKLAIPEFAYFLLVKDKLATFQKKYPEIEIELSMTDALSDILSDGFHAGFRLGGLIAEDMVAIRLSEPLKTAVVASPEYLEKNGKPRTPKDLLNHNCLRYRYQSSGQFAPWIFSGSESTYPVEVRGNMIANSSPATIDLSLQGVGLTYTFRDYCTNALESGELVEVLTEHQVTLPSMNIYFPKEYRSMMPLRLFIEHLNNETD